MQRAGLLWTVLEKVDMKHASVLTRFVYHFGGIHLSGIKSSNRET